MMKASFTIILSSLLCFAYSQAELTVVENISDSGVKSIITKSRNLENVCFTGDQKNSIGFTICHEKWEDSWNFHVKCDLWLDLNTHSINGTSLAIVLEDERIVYMLQDGEAPLNDKKKVNADNQGRVGLPKYISLFSAGYEPIAIDEDINTMEEAWDALKSSKYTEIQLFLPEKQMKFTFYPEKGFRRDDAFIFVDNFKAIDELQ